MDTNGITLGEFSRKKRHELKLSTADVARLSKGGGNIGISAGYISLIENGQVTNVSPAKLQTLARIYQVTDAEIFGIASGRNAEANAITEERLSRINFGYSKMPAAKRKQLDSLIDLLERECKRLADDEKSAT
jgi:transcriptional regulator with XRE-family HTH domain